MKKAILLLSIVCSMAHGRGIPRKYNDEATRKLQDLVEKVELWAGVAKPEFLNEVEKLILEGANPTDIDRTNPDEIAASIGKIPLIILLMRTPVMTNNVDIPAFEKTFKVVLDHSANLTRTIEYRFFPGNIFGATPTMIQMFLDHLPTKTRIQQQYKQEVKDRIIEDLKLFINVNTEQEKRHKQRAERAREQGSQEIYTSIMQHMEEEQKEANMYRKILDVIEQPPTLGTQAHQAKRGQN